MSQRPGEPWTRLASPPCYLIGNANGWRLDRPPTDADSGQAFPMVTDAEICRPISARRSSGRFSRQGSPVGWGPRLSLCSAPSSLPGWTAEPREPDSLGRGPESWGSWRGSGSFGNSLPAPWWTSEESQGLRETSWKGTSEIYLITTPTPPSTHGPCPDGEAGAPSRSGFYKQVQGQSRDKRQHGWPSGKHRAFHPTAPGELSGSSGEGTIS